MFRANMNLQPQRYAPIQKWLDLLWVRTQIGPGWHGTDFVEDFVGRHEQINNKL